MQVDELQSLIQGINARNGKINCARVAFRLDEHLAAGRNLGLPSVSTHSGGLFIYPKYVPTQSSSQTMLIKRSKTDNPVLISRCSTSSASSVAPTERIDLTHADKDQIIELDVDMAVTDGNEVKLKQTNAAQVYQDLCALPRRKKDGSAYGFIMYTWLDANKGHIANFYVSPQNQVYFLDAQGQDVSSWVSTALPSGYRPELFYLQSIPPEGFSLKQERGATEMYQNFAEVKQLSEERKQELLDHAEKYVLRAQNAAAADSPLTECQYNELAAAGYILYKKIERNPQEVVHAEKLFHWAQTAKACELGVLLAFSVYFKALGTPTQNKELNDKAAFDIIYNGLQTYPNSSVIAFNLALCHQQMRGTPTQDKLENAKAAFNLLTRALENNPKHPEAAYRLAGCYMQMQGTPTQNQLENDKAAFNLFTRALENNPTDLDAAYQLAFCYKQMRGTPTQNQLENDKAAFNLLTRAVENDPKHHDAAYLLAIHYMQMRGTPTQNQLENDKAAFNLLTRALENNPKHTEAAYHLAGCYMQMRGTPTQDKLENDKAAFNLLTRALENNPKHTDAAYQLAVCYMHMRGTPTQDKSENNKAAFNLLTRALENNPKHTDAAYQLAVCYMQMRGTPTQNQPENAKAAFNLLTRAVENNPKHTDATYHLAVCYMLMRGTPTQNQPENDKAALQLFESALIVSPNYKDTQYLISILKGRRPSATSAKPASASSPQAQSISVGPLAAAAVSSPLERPHQAAVVSATTASPQYPARTSASLPTFFPIAPTVFVRPTAPGTAAASSTLVSSPQVSTSSATAAPPQNSSQKRKAPSKDELLDTQRETIDTQKQLIAILRAENAALKLKYESRPADEPMTPQNRSS